MLALSSSRTLFIAAKEFGDQLSQVISMESILGVTVPSDNTIPTPKIGTQIEVINVIGSRLTLEKGPLDSIGKMIGYVRNRTPITGLPNQIRNPAMFEKSYLYIEKCLKVTSTIIEELYSKMGSSDDEARKKDFRERLESIYSRLSEISGFCGTRYTQDLPMLYQELAITDDLDCISEWNKDGISIPSFADPKMAIKAHLAPVLYKLKIEALQKVYAEVSGALNVHARSGFWKAVKETFHLDESVDFDPLANSYYVNMRVVKNLFFQHLDRRELFNKLKEVITNIGSENPYNALIGQLAAQNGEDRSEVLMKAFQIDEETYESEGMTYGFIALCLIESGLL